MLHYQIRNSITEELVHMANQNMSYYLLIHVGKRSVSASIWESQNSIYLISMYLDKNKWKNNSQSKSSYTYYIPMIRHYILYIFYIISNENNERKCNVNLIISLILSGVDIYLVAILLDVQKFTI